MSDFIERAKNIFNETKKMNVEELSNDSEALSKCVDATTELLIQSVELSMEVMDTLLPNLDKKKMKATLIKLLDDDRVKGLEITKEIKSQTDIMIDKFFESKTNVNSSNKTKKMVGGDPEICAICLETNRGVENANLVCCPSQPLHHIFHIDCALDWLLNNPLCPSCRSPWSPMEQPLLHPGDRYPDYDRDVHIPRNEPRRNRNRNRIANALVQEERLNRDFFVRELLLDIQRDNENNSSFLYLIAIIFLMSIMVKNNPLMSGPNEFIILIVNIMLYFMKLLNIRIFNFQLNEHSLVDIYEKQVFIYCIVMLVGLACSEYFPNSLVNEASQTLRYTNQYILRHATPEEQEAWRQVLIEESNRLRPRYWFSRFWGEGRFDQQMGGERKKARRKSRKIRGRKSNRKKLSKKTRRRV
tara:strand:+ start:449 stop:1690 length:1242 start_codon:yes stop_codon:yes gene_type:complete